MIKKFQKNISVPKLILAAIVVVLLGLYHFGYILDNPDWVINSASLRNFFTLTLSVIVAAFPFLVLGVTLSTLVTLYVDEKQLLKRLPRNRWTSHLLISMLGMLLPVCECGNIPIARRLILKGFTASQAITFLLAAPIINVVTILSTYEAFRFEPGILVARIIGGFVIAYLVGIIFSFFANQNALLAESFTPQLLNTRLTSIKTSRVKVAIETFQQEFISVFKLLVLGALLAAAIRIFLPNEVIVAIGTNPVLSVVAMILFAFIIAICSSIDAFFALSFVGQFTWGAIASFLIFGPMIDIKVLTLLQSTFRKQALTLLVAIVALAAFCVGLIINIVL